MWKGFFAEINEKFGLNKHTFRCYTIESYPLIKIKVFSKDGWDSCHIGFLINDNFHVLGLGSFSFKKEDAKVLYIALAHTIPDDELKLKIQKHPIIDDEEQTSIIAKLKQLFPTGEEKTSSNLD